METLTAGEGQACLKEEGVEVIEGFSRSYDSLVHLPDCTLTGMINAHSLDSYGNILQHPYHLNN